MKTQVSIEVNAALEDVWSVLVDVEKWSTWTSSIQAVRLIESEELELGSRVEIRQPKIPSLAWRVTEFNPLQDFTWEVRRLGLYAKATHRVEAIGDRLTRVTLSVHQTGLLTHLPWVGDRTRAYMNIEAAGLKDRSESVTQSGVSVGALK